MNKKFFPKKPGKRIRIKIERVISGFQGGIHKSAVSGIGMEFRGIRPYDPADSLAHIEWLASARLSEDDFSLVTKEFNPEREISVVCALEDQPSMGTPPRKQEHAAMLSWLFALSAFKYRDPFRFIRFSPDSISTTEWVRDEESLNASPVEQVKQNLFAYLSELNFANALLVIISDFNSHWHREYTKLRYLNPQKQNIRCLFIALDEWEGFKTSDHSIAFRNPENKGIKIFNLRKGGEAEQEVEQHRKHILSLKKNLRPLSTPLISLPLIDDDPLHGIRRELLKLGFE